MNAQTIRRPCWSTSAFAVAADPTPLEISALRHHVDRCKNLRGRYFGVYCAVDAVHAFVAPRLVTTVVVAFAVFGLGTLVFM